MATHSSILAWKIPWTEEPGRPQVTPCDHGVAKSQTQLSDFTFTFHFHMVYQHGFVLNCTVLAMFGRILKFILNIPQLGRQRGD